MAQNDGFREGEENFASILDVDRILDAIGRGEAIPETENFDSNDPAFADLVARREELYQDIPPAPDVSFLFAEDSGEESETEVAEAQGVRATVRACCALAPRQPLPGEFP